MSNIIRKHFPKSELHIRRPIVPNFADAFRWCWNKFDADYLFNLEDDWACVQEAPIEDMIKWMEAHTDVGVIRLTMWDAEETRVRAVTSSKADYNHIPYNAQDGFYEVPDWNKWRLGTSGHPSLYRGEFVRQLRAWLNPYYNPEKFIRLAEPTQKIVAQWRCGIWGVPSQKHQVEDIGRDWRFAHKFLKTGGPKDNKEWFLTYKKEENVERSEFDHNNL